MEPIRIIRTYDMAIDREAMIEARVWEDFLETRDPNLVILHDGARPTVFTCAHPTRKQVDAWEGMLTIERHRAAFRECVRSVTGLVYSNGDRRDWSPDGAGSGKPMRQHEYELFQPADVQHVGQIVWANGFFPRDRALYVPLLATCQVAMIGAGVASQRLRAARMKAQAALRSDDGKPPPEGPPPATP
jgi:hypothetical protein